MTRYALPNEIRNQYKVIPKTLSQEKIAYIEGAANAVMTGGFDSISCVGSGDSLFASMAAEHFFSLWSGSVSHAYDSLEFSRYMYKSVTERSVVLPISYSGETIRTLEATYAAKAQGAKIVAITRDKSSSMARLADFVVQNDSDNETSNCRTASFQSVNAILLLFALCMGKASSPGRHTDGIIEMVRALEGPIREYTEMIGPAVSDISRRLLGVRQFYFLGSGIGASISHYGASKLYETASIPSIISGLEQFSHCEIFSIDPGDCVVIIAQDGAAFSRAVEVADATRQLGVSVWGLSDVPAFEEHTDHFVRWPSTGIEELSVFMSIVPLQWFAYFHAVALNQNPDRVRHKEVNSPLIRECPYWDLSDYVRLKGMKEH